MSTKQIFQQKALEKLKSPEDMHELFVFTHPISWLTLIAVALIIFSVLVWAMFGVMANKVTGYGIILNANGIRNIISSNSGQIKDLSVDIGDSVEQNQIVAHIEQPTLEQNLLLQKEKLQVARSTIDMESRAADLSSSKEQLFRDSKVESLYSGKIISRRYNEGDVISDGSVLYSVQMDYLRDDMYAIIFVPVLEGGKVKRNMTVQISPGAVDSTEYGSLIGRVNYVSGHPVTSNDINVHIGNQELANWFMQKNGGSAIMVIVELIKDEDTSSGYLWTSLLGAEEKITSGMICNSTVIVKREAPIVKAFQKFSQWIRND